MEFHQRWFNKIFKELFSNSVVGHFLLSSSTGKFVSSQFMIRIEPDWSQKTLPSPYRRHNRDCAGDISGKSSELLSNKFANASLQILGLFIKLTYEDRDNEQIK